MTLNISNNKIEGFEAEVIEIVDIFIYSSIAKINTYVHIKDKEEPFPMCFNIEKKEIYDFILYAEDCRNVLAINNITNTFDIVTSKGIITGNKEYSLRDRILNPRDGDVISLIIQPLLIKIIILDWENTITNDNAMIITLTNYYRK
jgi:hypothetical protein